MEAVRDARSHLKGGVTRVTASEAHATPRRVHQPHPPAWWKTGEDLWRGDEPRPPAGVVMVRLGAHTSLRFARLCERCGTWAPQQTWSGLLAPLWWLYSPQIAAASRPRPRRREDPQLLAYLRRLGERLARRGGRMEWLAGSPWALLSTRQNMSLAGESFDYGPSPFWKPGSRLHRRLFSTRTGLYATASSADLPFRTCAGCRSPCVPACPA